MPELVPGSRGRTAPKLHYVNGRNLPFDVLADVCDVDVRNRTQVKRMTQALKEIRVYYYEEVGLPDGVTPEQWEQALARAIEARAQAYCVRFRNAELTPTALSAWWHQLTKPSANSNRSLDAREIASQQHQDVFADVREVLGIDKKE